jgi:putative RNA 2'-phosphotransferase
VIEKGIGPTSHAQVILSSKRNMAERIGRRSDSSPVLLTIQVQKTIAEGIVFFEAGETLYLADSIPVGCFTGPPLPKEKTEAAKPEKSKDPDSRKIAGSYLVDVAALIPETTHKGRKKKGKELRKEKDRKWMRKQQKKAGAPWKW